MSRLVDATTEPVDLVAGEQATNEPDPAAYNAFLGSANLVGINVVAISGERRASGDAPMTEVDLHAAFQCEEPYIHYRFDVVANLTDEDGTDFGSVNASVIVTLSVPELPSRECVEMFGATSATMMAHPYLREVVASTAQRLGFPNVLLPMILQNPKDNETSAPDEA